MIEVSEAVKLLLDNSKVCDEYITVDIQDACGMVSYEDIKAPINVPHFPKSAMDGYAVCAKDIETATANMPVKLKVVCELLAGDYKDVEYTKNTAVRVMTGALVPDGYDCVVRQEDTDYGEDFVNIYKAIGSYTNYCKIGEDIKKDSVIIKAGEIIRDVHIGLMASLGIAKLKIKRPLNVAIIATGTELVDLDNELTVGKIYNSTSYILSSKIKKYKQNVIASLRCDDEEKELAELIDRYAVEADLIITTGGVSVGKKDIIEAVLTNMGARNLFMKLNIQPGTPTKAFIYKGIPILNLSGNPYAALANFELFFYKYLAHYMGNLSYENEIKEAVLDSEYNKVNKNRRLLRAYYSDGYVRLVDNIHASSVIANLTECNCFIDLKANIEVKKGDIVKVILFKE